MGYPAAYRPKGGRSPGFKPGRVSGFQKKPVGKVIAFPKAAPSAGATPGDPSPGLSTKAKRQRKIARSIFNERGPKRPSLGPRGLVPKASTYQPFGKAARIARGRKALSFFKGGLKIRSMVFRWLMRTAAREAMELARRWWNLGGPNPHAPGWQLFSGRWGLYPRSSGRTGQHTVGSIANHTAGPTVFADPWGGIPTSWSEYDSVTQPNPTHWEFKVVGLGKQDVGVSPNVWWGLVSALAQGVLPEAVPYENPWGREDYNPYWNDKHWPEPLPHLQPYRHPKPMLDPDSMPINAPDELPVAAPIPYRLIPALRPNPARSPWQQTVRGNGERMPFVEDPLLGRLREPGRRHKKRFKDEPDVIEINYGGTRWRSLSWRGERTGPYRKSPPKKRTKELKSKYLGFRHGLIFRFLNQLTEYQDLVDALYKALPRAMRPKGKLKFDDKLRALYFGADTIDLKKAFEAIIKNELQDMIYGLMGRVSSKTAKAIGSPVDLNQRAFRKGQQQTRDAVNELVDAIWDSVFAGKQTSGYDANWLHKEYLNAT